MRAHARRESSDPAIGSRADRDEPERAVTASARHVNASAGRVAPIPFEKCCEIQGAMQAWSKTGQDVNAMLAKTFGMNAQDFSAAHTWWLSQLTADVAKFPRYTELCDHYERQYSAGAPAAPDSDLSF